MDVSSCRRAYLGLLISYWTVFFFLGVGGEGWAADELFFFFASSSPRPTNNSQAFLLSIPSMSVLLETSLGDLVVDLLVGEAPKPCEK